nr:toprim domain-containing protein [Actinomycetota bacterium]
EPPHAVLSPATPQPPPRPKTSPPSTPPTTHPLPTESVAQHYLTPRGIDIAVLEAHTGRPETGHTPTNADGLVTTLRARGFSNDELVDAGLAHRNPDDGQLSDFYRQRVLIPVRDDHQRVVGLIGRNIGDQQRWAKYKNPPRTAIYDKAVNLYQPLPAPADPDGQVIIVEGTLDAIAIAVAAIRTGQANQYCPITQSGRELSAEQVRRVLDLHPGPPVLGFDADPAGQESNARLMDVFDKVARTPTIAVLPDGEDPASWLEKRGTAGLEAWSRRKQRLQTHGMRRPGPPRLRRVMPGGVRPAHELTAATETVGF